MDMTQAEWRPIAGFEGRYEVSNLGMVRSLRRVATRTNKTTGEITYFVNRGRVLKPIPQSTGYLNVALGCGKKRVTYQTGIHALVLEAFTCPRPDGQETRHKDGNPKNNNLTNLQWGTRKENSDDKIRHGTMCQGERHGQSKLSADDVIKIRTSRESPRKLGNIFGVSKTQIRRIKNGTSWSSLKSEDQQQGV